MTGYCRLCGFRLEGPTSPFELLGSPEQRARDELVGLGLVALQHLGTNHGRQLANLFAVIGSLNSLIACYCLNPVSLVKPGPEFTPATQAPVSLEEARDRLKDEAIRWLSSLDDGFGIIQ